MNNGRGRLTDQSQGSTRSWWPDAAAPPPPPPPSWVRTYKAKNALRDKTKHFEPMEQKSKIYTNNF